MPDRKNISDKEPDDQSENEQPTSDLHDNKADNERLKQDEGSLDLPDVEDIPGQEHITAPPLGDLADTTISSDDEEGDDLLEDEERS